MNKATIHNYHLASTGTFKNRTADFINFDYFNKNQYYQKIMTKKFEKWLASQGFKFHYYSPSPMKIGSGSMYFYNEITNELMRISDHWGIVASCIWRLENWETNSDGKWSNGTKVAVGIINLDDLKISEE